MGELSNSILFAIFGGFVAGIMGLMVISKFKKQQRCAEQNKEQEKPEN